MLRKADDSLRVARLLCNEGLYGFAAGRAYYAMFYAAEALLTASDMSFSKHSAVIARPQHCDVTKDVRDFGVMPLTSVAGGPTALKGSAPPACYWIGRSELESSAMSVEDK